MKEFLFLFRGGESGRMDALPGTDDWKAYMQQWMTWMEGLTEQGHYAGSQALKDRGKIVTGTAKVVTDGPFAEGKEIVGGYLICKADTLEQAVELSKGCPLLVFDDASIEVREINFHIMD